MWQQQQQHEQLEEVKQHQSNRNQYSSSINHHRNNHHNYHRHHSNSIEVDTSVLSNNLTISSRFGCVNSHHCLCRNSNFKKKKMFPLKSSTFSIVCCIFVLALVVERLPSGVDASTAGLNVVKLPSLYWNVNNRLFSDPTSQQHNYYLKLYAHIGDSIDLVCPRSQNSTNPNNLNLNNNNNIVQDPTNTNYDYSIIYRVGSRHEFDNCIIDADNYETMPILKCDKPQTQLVKFTINFVKYTPVPNALEFEEDREYFFLSTSSGTRQGLNFASGGLCSQFNMRFSIIIQSQSPPPPSPTHLSHHSSKSNNNRNNNNNNRSPSSSLLLSKMINGEEVQQDEGELDEEEREFRVASSSSSSPTNADDSPDDELKMSKMNLIVSSSGAILRPMWRVPTALAFVLILLLRYLSS